MLPPIVDKTFVVKFFERLTLCLKLPIELGTIIDDDLHSWLMKQVKPDVLCVFEDAHFMIPRTTLEDQFKKWNNQNSKNTGKVAKIKKFLDHEKTKDWHERIISSLNRESKHSQTVDHYYVNRLIEAHEAEGKRPVIYKNDAFEQNLKNLFLNSQVLILIAEPGMGKTTFLRNLGFKTQKLSHRHVCFMPLQEMNDDPNKNRFSNVQTMVGDMLRNGPSDEDLEFIKNKLTCDKDDSILFILDGFDEIKPNLHEKAINSIDELLNLPIKQKRKIVKKHRSKMLKRKYS